MALSRRGFIGAVGATAATLAGLPLEAAEPERRRVAKVEVLGHRGACAWRPEHTLASYAKAIADGADYVEPDLVCTKDGVLVARHECNILETTDIAQHAEFANRRTTKTIDGETQTGWFVEDFTLAELKTLRAIERLPKLRPANTAFDGQFQVPSFEEIIDFVAAESAARGRVIGLIPEIKHSTYLSRIGLPMEDRFLGVLGEHAYTRTNPVEIQSFEIANLKYLRSKLGHREQLRLMQLVWMGDEQPADVVASGGKLTWAEMLTPKGLADIAGYADVVAPLNRALIPVDAAGRLGQPTPVIADAHRAGLLVHTYTFRPENHFLPTDLANQNGDAARNPAGSIAEMRRYIDAGIDGFFTDDPGLGRLAVDG